MKKQNRIFLCIAGLLIAGCVFLQVAPAASKNVDTALNETSTKELSTVKEEVNIALKEIENRYLKDKLSFKEDITQLGTEYRQELKEFKNLLFSIASFIVIALTLLSFFGFKKYFSIDYKINKTLDLFNIMEKEIREKEKELHERFEGTIGKEKKEYTILDEANFLDYEHKLYFAYLYLPIGRDEKKYKKSLFLLGSYWIDKKYYGRALLRFKEIERIQDELDDRKNYLFRLLKSFGRKTIIEERILGKNTGKFFNLYGIACHGCAEKSIDKDKRDPFVKLAETYYNKSISINPNHSSPHYNLGLLYSLVESDNEKGIEWYNKTIGKIPDKSLDTYRNIACCQVRLERPVKEIIKTLNNIPNCDDYWDEIVGDEVLKPKIKSNAKLAGFINEKCPRLKLSSS